MNQIFFSPGTDCLYPGVFVPPSNKEELFNAGDHPDGVVTVPFMNVIETDDSYNIEVAAPGNERNNFLVSIKDNVLSVSVNKCSDRNNSLYHQHEFNYRCFKREIPLPGNIDLDFISASYHRGILYQNLPKGQKRLTGSVERIIIY